MNKLDQQITEYISELEERKKRSLRTVRNYDFYLRRFSIWLSKQNISSIQKVTEETIEKYRDWLKKYQDPVRKTLLKQTTINYHLIALRNFLEFLMRRRVVVINYNRVKLDKIKGIRNVYLEKDELVKLLEAPIDFENDKILRARDKALLEVLFSTGLKVSEITRLRKKQLKPNEKQSNFIELDSSARSNLSNQAGRAIGKYLLLRKDKLQPLFISHDRAMLGRNQIAGLSARSIERLIEKYAKIIGLKKRVTPQVIRHTYAINKIVRGSDPDDLRKQLGFKDLATLKSYIRRF